MFENKKENDSRERLESVIFYYIKRYTYQHAETNKNKTRIYNSVNDVEFNHSATYYTQQ